ncbi:hypothetical protein [Psychroserpens algicola]|uniref:hypothetical protein n=1 Tax=Psychroserpens algicola TaxID=1719034 RepID=UPI001954A0DF|nr:hypothetical protein [Psychroserpens algicola]
MSYETRFIVLAINIYFDDANDQGTILAETNVPLERVSIYAKKGDIGTVSNAYGRFIRGLCY